MGQVCGWLHSVLGATNRTRDRRPNLMAMLVAAILKNGCHTQTHQGISCRQVDYYTFIGRPQEYSAYYVCM